MRSRTDYQYDYKYKYSQPGQRRSRSPQIHPKTSKYTRSSKYPKTEAETPIRVPRPPTKTAMNSEKNSTAPYSKLSSPGAKTGLMTPSGSTHLRSPPGLQNRAVGSASSTALSGAGFKPFRPAFSNKNRDEHLKKLYMQLEGASKGIGDTHDQSKEYSESEAKSIIKNIRRRHFSPVNPQKPNQVHTINSSLEATVLSSERPEGSFKFRFNAKRRGSKGYLDKSISEGLDVNKFTLESEMDSGRCSEDYFSKVRGVRGRFREDEEEGFREDDYVYSGRSGDWGAACASTKVPGKVESVSNQVSSGFERKNEELSPESKYRYEGKVQDQKSYKREYCRSKYSRYSRGETSPSKTPESGFSKEKNVRESKFSKKYEPNRIRASYLSKGDRGSISPSAATPPPTRLNRGVKSGQFHKNGMTEFHKTPPLVPPKEHDYGYHAALEQALKHPRSPTRREELPNTHQNQITATTTTEVTTTTNTAIITTTMQQEEIPVTDVTSIYNDQNGFKRSKLLNTYYSFSQQDSVFTGPYSRFGAPCGDSKRTEDHPPPLKIPKSSIGTPDSKSTNMRLEANRSSLNHFYMDQSVVDNSRAYYETENMIFNNIVEEYDDSALDDQSLTLQGIEKNQLFNEYYQDRDRSPSQETSLLEQSNLLFSKMEHSIDENNEEYKYHYSRRGLNTTQQTIDLIETEIVVAQCSPTTDGRDTCGQRRESNGTLIDIIEAGEGTEEATDVRNESTDTEGFLKKKFICLGDGEDESSLCRFEEGGGRQEHAPEEFKNKLKIMNEHELTERVPNFTCFDSEIEDAALKKNIERLNRLGGVDAEGRFVVGGGFVREHSKERGQLDEEEQKMTDRSLAILKEMKNYINRKKMITGTNFDSVDSCYMAATSVAKKFFSGTSSKINDENNENKLKKSKISPNTNEDKPARNINRVRPIEVSLEDPSNPNQSINSFLHSKKPNNKSDSKELTSELSSILHDDLHPGQAPSKHLFEEFSSKKKSRKKRRKTKKSRQSSLSEDSIAREHSHNRPSQHKKPKKKRKSRKSKRREKRRRDSSKSRVTTYEEHSRLKSEFLNEKTNLQDLEEQRPYMGSLESHYTKISTNLLDIARLDVGRTDPNQPELGSDQILQNMSPHQQEIQEYTQEYEMDDGSGFSPQSPSECQRGRQGVDSASRDKKYSKTYNFKLSSKLAMLFDKKNTTSEKRSKSRIRSQYYGQDELDNRENINGASFESLERSPAQRRLQRAKNSENELADLELERERNLVARRGEEDSRGFVRVDSVDLSAQNSGNKKKRGRRSSNKSRRSRHHRGFSSSKKGAKTGQEIQGSPFKQGFSNLKGSLEISDSISPIRPKTKTGRRGAIEETQERQEVTEHHLKHERSDHKDYESRLEDINHSDQKSPKVEELRHRDEGNHHSRVYEHQKQTENRLYHRDKPESNIQDPKSRWEPSNLDSSVADFSVNNNWRKNQPRISTSSQKHTKNHHFSKNPKEAGHGVLKTQGAQPYPKMAYFNDPGVNGQVSALTRPKVESVDGELKQSIDKLEGTDLVSERILPPEMTVRKEETVDRDRALLEDKPTNKSRENASPSALKEKEAHQAGFGERETEEYLNEAVEGLRANRESRNYNDLRGSRNSQISQKFGKSEHREVVEEIRHKEAHKQPRITQYRRSFPKIEPKININEYSTNHHQMHEKNLKRSPTSNTDLHRDPKPHKTPPRIPKQPSTPIVDRTAKSQYSQSFINRRCNEEDEANAYLSVITSNRTMEPHSYRSNYSYGGKPISFLERIYKGLYTDADGVKGSGFGGYVNECKDQVIVTRKIMDEIRYRRFSERDVEIERNERKRKVLLLDLDETLIHAEDYQLGVSYDFKIELNTIYDDGYEEVAEIGVFVRPYCIEFLKRMSRKFTIVIFTASNKDYADKILDQLDPNHAYISSRLYRGQCRDFDDLYVKDLRIIQNVKTIDMIIIDNIICSYAVNLENGIPIRPYCYGHQDYELKYIADKLEKLKDYEKSTEFLKRSFRLDKFYDFLCE